MFNFKVKKSEQNNENKNNEADEGIELLKKAQILLNTMQLDTVAYLCVDPDTKELV